MRYRLFKLVPGFGCRAGVKHRLAAQAKPRLLIKAEPRLPIQAEPRLCIQLEPRLPISAAWVVRPAVHKGGTDSGIV